ncbi:MAG: hypothetical protein ABI554_10230 [Flavobacterium sp.]
MRTKTRNTTLHYFRLLLFVFASILFTNCSGDDGGNNDTDGSIENNEFTSPRATFIAITPNVTASSEATYNWAVKKALSDNIH